MKGSLDVRIWRDRRLVEHTTDNNLIVASSRAPLAHLIGGAVAGNSVVQIGYGSSPAAIAPGNTGLSLDAYIKGLDSVTYPQPGQVAFGISLGVLEGNGQVIAEYGLLCGNGALFARLVRAAPITKDLSISISATWTVTF